MYKLNYLITELKIILLDSQTISKNLEFRVHFEGELQDCRKARGVTLRKASFVIFDFQCVDVYDGTIAKCDPEIPWPFARSAGFSEL